MRDGGDLLIRRPKLLTPDLESPLHYKWTLCDVSNVIVLKLESKNLIRVHCVDFFSPLHSDLEWPSVPDLRLISFAPNEQDDEKYFVKMSIENWSSEGMRVCRFVLIKETRGLAMNMRSV